MTKDAGITIASNRGPVSFTQTPEGFETKRGAGGLAGAVDPVARALGEDAVWIAAATSDGDRLAIAQGAVDEFSDSLGYRLKLLDIDLDTYTQYYDEVSNRMLWFANHCLWDEIGAPSFAIDAWRDAYRSVNRLFAESVAELTHPGALVLWQDYHLSTAPAELRRRRGDLTMLHFTHSSFCDLSGGLGRLPEPVAKETILGMLGADLVGFHVPRWTNNFLGCCAALDIDVDRDSGSVDMDGRRVWARSYPIPIDTADLRQRAAAPESRAWAQRLRRWAGNRKLVARVDRSEPSKNIVRGFEAFGAMLDREPALRDEVAFVACAYPSRESMSEYQDYAERISAAVEDINSRHPDSIELFSEDDFDRSLGAQITYDVLLVNPIMDGMNLVAKEGPALNENDGVLVLSSGAGAYDEMSEHAITIDDPLDIDETVAALKKALALPADERRRRAKALRERATARTPSDWIAPQLDDLRLIRSGQEPATGS